MGDLYYNIDNKLVLSGGKAPYIKLVNRYIATGYSFTLSLKNDNTTWGWGYNNYGQLGDNSVTYRSTPVSILGNTKDIYKIDAGSDHSICIDKRGQIWGWGNNYHGQVGDNSVTSRSTPFSIIGTRKTFCQLSCGYYHSMGIDNHGQVWGWGYNGSRLGNNSDPPDSHSTPISIHGNKKTFCKISAGWDHTISIDKNGQVWAWGYNEYSQLGNASGGLEDTPVSIHGTKKTFCHISCGKNYSMAIDKDGVTWGWGYNYYGQVGNNSHDGPNTPVEIYMGKEEEYRYTFCKISCGEFHTISIDKNGQVWGWGNNRAGQLGDNSITNRSTPVSILGTKKTFCKISCGGYHSIGIDNRGRLWGWGLNEHGQLDNNNLTDRSTPVMISNI